MTNFVDMTAQVQIANWGWTIAIFLWLVGLSGMGMLVNYWLRQKALVYVCTLAGIVGTLFVLGHLARLSKLIPAAFNALTTMNFNLHSWMMIGILLLAAQCLIGIIYSLALAGTIGNGRAWSQNHVFNGLAAAIGVAVTIYSGFLLTQAVGVTLWNTALIPVLWIISGLASAFAAIALLSSFGLLQTKFAGELHRVGLWTEVAELIALFAFIHVGLTAVSPAARMGAQALLSGPQATMFWLGVIAIGIIVPMLVNTVMKNRTGAMISGVCALIGALLLRASVLLSGYYDPYFF